MTSASQFRGPRNSELKWRKSARGKVDIEGAEYDTIEAAADSAFRMIRSLIIEFHENGFMRSRLHNLGFTDMTEGRNLHVRSISCARLRPKSLIY